MFNYWYLCGVLLIASVRSENLTLSEINHTKESSSKLDVTNKMNLLVVSEGGGSLLPNTPDLSLPKDKLNSLMSLDEELSKTKEKAVVPRKGVETQVDEEKPVPIDNTKKLNLLPKILTTTTKNPAAVTRKPNDNDVNSILPNTKLDVSKYENTKASAPKKPTILSYEALAKMEKQIQSDLSKPPVAPSTKTMANSQIPSPHQDSIKKVYPSKAINSHPGMIMPIVITILVVPMFAIVGYFALKRGQEAWKNRHYKRMDFLLDGMYND